MLAHTKDDPATVRAFRVLSHSSRRRARSFRNGLGFDRLEGRQAPSGNLIEQVALGGATFLDLFEDKDDQGNELVTGTATALASQVDALAYALLLQEVVTGSGADVITGFSEAEGFGVVEARGVSVGFSETDVVGVSEFNGLVDTRAGNDRIQGDAVASTPSSGLDDELFFVGANGVIVDLDSQLLLGNGDDFVAGNADLVAFGVSDDPDLEVISDGFENVGTVDLGSGNDTIVTRSRAEATGDAKAIADGIDNSSVGNPNAATVFRLGAGDDRIDSQGSALARGDAALANGLDTRTLLEGNNGNDGLFLRGEAVFEADPNFTADQPEAIGDGLENRGTINLGNGNDTINGTGIARGNGVLTIADGLDSRGQILTGGGNDTIIGRGEAEATAGSDASNVVLTSGILTENVDAGRIVTGGGADRIDGSSNAIGGPGSTTAIGITNISFDLPNDAVLSSVQTGGGNDVVVGTATAVGSGDVSAFGLLGGRFDLGGNNDELIGTAIVNGASTVRAVGLLVEDPAAAAVLTGDGADLIRGDAQVNDPSAIGTATGIFVDNIDRINTGNGNDVIIGTASAAGSQVETFGIAGTGQINTGAGNDRIDAGSFGGGISIRTGNNDDVVIGFGEAIVNGGGGNDLLVIDLPAQPLVTEVSPTRTNITFDGVTMVAINFETISIQVV